MEDAEFVALHESGGLTDDLDRLRGAVGDRHLFVLPRPFDPMPGDVAAELLDAGADPSLAALVLERLPHDDESITRTSLGSRSTPAGAAPSRPRSRTCRCWQCGGRETRSSPPRRVRDPRYPSRPAT